MPLRGHSIRAEKRLHEHVGRKIHELRTLRRCSAADLAAAVGVTEVTILQWEVGHERVDARSLCKVASALGTNIAFFFSDEGAAHVMGREFSSTIARLYQRSPEQARALLTLTQALAGVEHPSHERR